MLERGTAGSRLRIVCMDDEPAPLLANAAAMHVSVVPAPTLPVPLGELPVGSQTRVVEVKGGGKHQRRKLEMGLVPGTEVVVVREAPWTTRWSIGSRERLFPCAGTTLIQSW